MGKIILYHGSPDKEIKPAFGLGENRHDYGKGFYLTENIDLAKEWAVCRPDETNGWVHKYELDMEGLKVLDFQKYSILSWLAELMKHRDAADSKRYRMLSQKFIAKYGIETSGYDVIKGWRADASYFYIAKAFVRDEIDVEILESSFCWEVWEYSIVLNQNWHIRGCLREKKNLFPWNMTSLMKNTMNAM